MLVVTERNYFLPRLYKRYLPWLATIPVMQGMTWMPTWKSLPNSVKAKRYGPPSCFTDFVHEILSYGIRNLIHTKTEFITSGRMRIGSNVTLDGIYPVCPRSPNFLSGRIGMVEEGGGKRRLFANRKLYQSASFALVS
jgi:hypothetical protein